MKKHFLLLLMAFTFSQLFAQSKSDSRVPLMGEKAPEFTAKSTKGDLIFPDDLGSNWKIIFSHPKNFTPVCSSELLELALKQDVLKSLGISPVILSADILSHHKDWVLALESINYKGNGTIKIDFPLIDDSNLLISHKYGLIHPSISMAENIRGVFVIDPKNVIRTISFYPMEVGRNIDELIRSVVALQAIDANKNIATPANWQNGDQVLVPVLTDKERASLGTPESEFTSLSWFMNYRSLK
jgi:peroxiredoxin 2/4